LAQQQLYPHAQKAAPTRTCLRSSTMPPTNLLPALFAKQAHFQLLLPVPAAACVLA